MIRRTGLFSSSLLTSLLTRAVDTPQSQRMEKREQRNIWSVMYRQTCSRRAPTRCFSRLHSLPAPPSSPPSCLTPLTLWKIWKLRIFNSGKKFSSTFTHSSESPEAKKNSSYQNFFLQFFVLQAISCLVYHKTARPAHEYFLTFSFSETN